MRFLKKRIVVTPKPYLDKTVADHGPDFRSVRWYGTEYSFTGNQAKIVSVLWAAWKQGTPDVGDEHLMVHADAKTSRIVDIFRDCDAWGRMIVQGARKGTRRLQTPSTS